MPLSKLVRALAACAALALPLAAQTTAEHHDAPLDPKLPTLFLVGDSTAHNHADLGWGDHLAHLFDTSRINIANRALADSSARSYIDEGHWAQVLAEMKPGDFLLLQLGHNDSGELAGDRPFGDLKGIGPETQDVPQTAGPFAGKVETVHTYGWYMRKMIDEAKARDVTPMLLTLTPRNIWVHGRMERDIGYTDLIRQIAAQERIRVIDMNAISANSFESMGEKETATFFPLDPTHTNTLGAEINANAAARAIAVARAPLAEYLAGHD